MGLYRIIEIECLQGNGAAKFLLEKTLEVFVKILFHDRKIG